MINHQRDFQLFAKDRRISGLTMHNYNKRFNSNINGSYINPTIIEERQLNVASMDVFSRLMMDRIIFLGTGIDDTVGNVITAQLLYLASVDKTTPISLYLNSPGGAVHSGMSIYDTMNFVSCDVNTIVCGMAASMGFILTINGKHRSALKHSRLMQHQPMGSANGQATDILIEATQIKIIRDELYEIIAEKTKQPLEKVAIDCERDYWMTAIEAKTYGVLDKVIGVD